MAGKISGILVKPNFVIYRITTLMRITDKQPWNKIFFVHIGLKQVVNLIKEVKGAFRFSLTNDMISTSPVNFFILEFDFQRGRAGIYFSCNKRIIISLEFQFLTSDEGSVFDRY
jgi:hypothetical protein